MQIKKLGIVFSVSFGNICQIAMLFSTIFIAFPQHIYRHGSYKKIFYFHQLSKGNLGHGNFCNLGYTVEVKSIHTVDQKKQNYNLHDDECIITRQQFVDKMSINICR